MKKIVVLIAVIAAVVFATGCQRMDNVIKEEENSTEINDNSDVVTKGVGFNRTWYGTLGECGSPSGDCFDDVNIVGKRTLWDKIKHLFKNACWECLEPNTWYMFSPNPNDPNDPQTIIYDFISTIPKEYIQGFIDGKLKVSYFENTNSIYIIFSENKAVKKPIVTVFPLAFKEIE